MALSLTAGQPRHLLMGDDPISEEDILLVEVENEAVLASLLAEGCVGWYSAVRTDAHHCQSETFASKDMNGSAMAMLCGCP
jgi:hypothetical protein